MKRLDSVMTGRRILLADDDDDVRDYIMRMMVDRYPSLQVREAHDGKEALAIAVEWKPDLIITDLAMPTMDGYEVIQAIRQNPTTRQTPILVLTSFSMTDTQIDALDSGADDFLGKPMNRMELLGRIRALLTARDRYLGAKNGADPMVRMSLVKSVLQETLGAPAATEILAKIIGKM